MAGVYPVINDNDVNLLQKIARNTASIVDNGGGNVAVQDGGIEIVAQASVFNFTGAGVTVFDDGSGVARINIPGGGGGSYPEVANFAGLPAAAAHTGEIYVCLASQGTRFVNRKAAGFYLSDGANWIILAELEEDYFNTTYLQFYDPTDPTKKAVWDISGFTAATTRTFTLPNASGTIALLADLAAYQPLDADLTAIAALATTAFGRGLLTEANAASLRTTAGLVIGTNVQAWDTDLDAIAALAPSNDDIIQRKAGAWTNRTMVQLKSDLALTSSDVGLGNVTNNAQTQAAIVPNTAPAAGEILVGNAGGTAYAKQAMSGDATLASTGALTIANSAVTNAKMATSAKTGSIQFGKSNNGSALSTGVMDFAPQIPVGATITAWSISVDTGTATVKFWKKATGTTIPTVADVINTSGVSISSGTHVRSTTVTDFTTTAISANDLFRCDLTAVSGATWINVTLEYTRT